jgi:predicted ArsR family transcriptional regulator
MNPAETPEVAAGGPTRRAVLFTLRRDGPLSPDRLASLIGISRTAVLQQLRALTAGGLVRKSSVRHGVGRPRHLYELTLRAQDHFPSNYTALTAGLLRAMDDVGGPKLIEQVFQTRRHQLAQQIRGRLAEKGLEDAPLEDRARELALIQDEQGYLCECRREPVEATTPTGRDELAPIQLGDDGVIRLREHNCAIYDVATATPAACRAEVQLFRDVLRARVVRETHIASGDRSCTYRIEERRSHS